MLRLKVLHRVVQEEVNEDSVDAICPSRCVIIVCFLDCFVLLVLVVVICIIVISGFRGWLFTAHLDLWVTPLDLSFDQFHAPDTRASELNFPIRSWFNGLQVADVRL